MSLPLNVDSFIPYVLLQQLICLFAIGLNHHTYSLFTSDESGEGVHPSREGVVAVCQFIISTWYTGFGFEQPEKEFLATN